MVDIFCYFLVFLGFVIMIIGAILATKPSGNVVKKYGKPLGYFSTMKCWNTLPIRHTSVRMYIYSDFVIVSDAGKDYFFDKSFKDFKLYGSILIKIFEIKVSEIKTIQINITFKQEKMLKEFFNIE